MSTNIAILVLTQLLVAAFIVASHYFTSTRLTPPQPAEGRVKRLFLYATGMLCIFVPTTFGILIVSPEMWPAVAIFWLSAAMAAITTILCHVYDHWAADNAIKKGEKLAPTL